MNVNYILRCIYFLLSPLWIFLRLYLYKIEFNSLKVVTRKFVYYCSISLVRGGLTLFASIFASFGQRKMVIIFGISSLFIVFNEFIIDNSIKKSQLKNTEIGPEAPKLKKIYIFTVIFSILLFFCGYFFENSTYRQMLFFFSTLLFLIMTIFYLRKLNNLYNRLLIISESHFHHSSIAIKNLIHKLASSRGLLGSMATVLALFPFLPILTLKIIGNLILMISFIEAILQIKDAKLQIKDLK